MDFPDFFAAAPTITLRDPLAAFLGVSKSGTMTYGYTDAVKLAAHSCPTVAGAYLMVRRGLAYLYGEKLPERGGMEVYLREEREQGTTGVIAAVATLLTGAAPETGFGGIGTHHRFARRGVVLDLDTASVPPDPAMRPLFLRAVAGKTDDDEQTLFAALWQGHVARMLLEHADDPDLVSACAWQPTVQTPAPKLS